DRMWPAFARAIGREMILEMEYPGRGKMQTIGCPVKLRNSCVALERPPLLGENTDALLRDLCQVEPEELQRLRREGVT
ncbi:MAG: hypothetical protein ACXWCH_33130, partial [Burkholderiales bacterium]